MPKRKYPAFYWYQKRLDGGKAIMHRTVKKKTFLYRLKLVTELESTLSVWWCIRYSDNEDDVNESIHYTRDMFGQCFKDLKIFAAKDELEFITSKTL
jgi:hypothetical protein